MNKIESVNTEEVSLKNCDKEPIHIPGYIQQFAVCLSTDEYLQSIRYCSDNVHTIFDSSHHEILDKNLIQIFDKDIIHDLNFALNLPSARFQRQKACVCSFYGTNYEIWVHRSGKFPVIEIEYENLEGTSSEEANALVRSLTADLVKQDDLKSTYKVSVNGLRELTGFDRVMLYQFDANGNGDIKAESKGAEFDAFFGLRFPSWDIPKQAREILKKIPLRLIADVNGEPVPLSCKAPGESPLDLSLAECRGQSPIFLKKSE